MIERLMQVGFSSQEARVYVALLRQPSATGYEIAKVAGLQRANVYQVLAGLSDRGVVEQVSDSPARFVALPPAEVLGRVKRETASRCEALIVDLAAMATPSEPAAFWTLRGRDAVLERAGALVADARERVAVCVMADDLAWLGPALRSAAQTGCQVVVNVFGDVPVDFGEVYRHEPQDMTVGGHVLTLAVDSTTALIASLDEPAGAVYTAHPALLRVVEKLIRDEAYLAAIYERLRPELEGAFGRHLVELRARLLPPDQASRLMSVVGFGADPAAVNELLPD
ncbi:helix-turn-helix domain-containing protein [Actinopolymorpha sp. B9G3]|uniref:TrmB family transcriptional regulator n=1 Tax=Actinopolymorpha sp. B9G3 TaxID=3158970 RepID=UPI0032D91A33